MAVTFTPNLALAKPDQTELALNWARGTKLQEDNNIIIAARAEKTLTAYTPTLIANTANPSIGAGTIKGEYQEIEGCIFGSFAIVFTDPGVAAGTGEYGISLPLPADGAFHSVGTTLTANPGAFSCIGEGYLLDASSVDLSGTVALDVTTIAGVSYVRLITSVFTGKTSRVYLPGQPYTVVTGDKMAGGFIYKKA